MQIHLHEDEAFRMPEEEVRLKKEGTVAATKIFILDLSVIVFD